MSEIINLFEGEKIVINKSGMWDATAMCKKYNKRVNNFFRTQQTKDYFSALKRKYNYSDDELVQVIQGGNNQKEQGTWIHRKVALKLAAWLNPDFEVWVFDIIEKLLTQGEVKLKDEIAELQNCLDISEYRLEESKAKAEYWQNEYSLYRHGHHPEYEEVGQFQEGDLLLGMPTENKVD
ncbi:KilA-N domain-containing protein [Okeania sp. KiyG1]|uniref:KilA-N domain-containing protein n=1 Tax=Okeania sp. KiyG1 TaxID=2720165 RepID=UPI001923E4F5|nr:KilA-N domain-containing protein [Okeania sp. KiyG1]GGA02438.1 hypothetical protein CYANOKiyG1_14500 [Okeania sp. KiyG1]